MTIPAYRYGDPAKVLEREEGQTCKGCLHMDRLWGHEHCGLGIGRLAIESRAQVMRMTRCVRYNNGSGNGQT